MPARCGGPGSARFVAKGGQELAPTRLETDCDVGAVLNPTVTQHTLERVLRANDVRALDLSSCKWLDSAALRLAVELAPKLHALDLDRCRQGCDDGVMEELGLGAPLLKCLSLRSCPRVTLLGLSFVLAHCPKLTRLDASYNPGLVALPKERENDDLEAAFRASVPTCLRGEIQLHTKSCAGNQLKAAREEFCYFLSRLEELSELELHGVQGVDDELLAGIWPGRAEAAAAAAEEEEKDSEESQAQDDGLEDAKQGGSQSQSVFAERGGNSAVPGTGDGVPESAEEADCEQQAEQAEQAQKAQQAKEERARRPCSTIRALGLSGCTGVTHQGLEHMAFACRGLSKLDVSMCSRIETEGIIAIADLCDSLEQVDLSGLHLIESAGVVRLVEQHGKSLRRLALAGCKRLGKGVVDAIGEHCVMLEFLDLSGCGDLLPIELFRLVTGNSAMLSKVVLTGCFQVEQRTMEDLHARAKMARPGLKFVRARDKALGDPASSGIVPNWKPLPAGQLLKNIAKDGGKAKSSGSKKKK